MRLSEEQVQHIVSCFNHLKPSEASLLLYGSRVDPLRKGGDIDLLVVLAKGYSLEQFPRLEFLANLKKALGDRKIDVTIAKEEELLADPFLQTILPTAIRLV